MVSSEEAKTFSLLKWFLTFFGFLCSPSYPSPPQIYPTIYAAASCVFHFAAFFKIAHFAHLPLAKLFCFSCTYYAPSPNDNTTARNRHNLDIWPLEKTKNHRQTNVHRWILIEMLKASLPVQLSIHYSLSLNIFFRLFETSNGFSLIVFFIPLLLLISTLLSSVRLIISFKSG